MLTPQLTIGHSFGLPSPHFIPKIGTWKRSEPPRWPHLLGSQPCFFGWCGWKNAHPITQRSPTNVTSKQFYSCQTALFTNYWLPKTRRGPFFGSPSASWFPKVHLEQAIGVSIRCCATSNLCAVSGNEAKPNIRVGNTVAWRNCSLNPRNTCLFNNRNLCWWNLPQTHSEIAWEIVAQIFVCRVAVQKIATIDPHISRWIVSCMVGVVQTYLFMPFNSNLMRESSRALHPW